MMISRRTYADAPRKARANAAGHAINFTALAVLLLLTLLSAGVSYAQDTPAAGQANANAAKIAVIDQQINDLRQKMDDFNTAQAALNKAGDAAGAQAAWNNMQKVENQIEALEKQKEQLTGKNECGPKCKGVCILGVCSAK